jgi:hypothetical protein
MTKYIVSAAIVAIAVTLVSFVRSQYKGMRYAIQNTRTGKNLRPLAAGKENGNRLVQYDHHSWKCMTWDFNEVGPQTYLLKNRYTGKTFQTIGEPLANSKLSQQEVIEGTSQQWELIKLTESVFRIKLKGKNLFLSVPGDETNADVILVPLKEDDAQLWRLVRQNPLF